MSAPEIAPLYGPTPRRQERRQAERLPAAESSTLTACPFHTVLDAHAQAIDAAHSRLREADGELAELSSITTHAVARLVHLEQSSREHEQLLAALQGGIDAIKAEQAGILRAIQSLSDVSTSTHDLVVRHIDRATLVESDAQRERLVGHEQQINQLVKIAGLLTAVAISLVLIHGALTDRPIAETLFGWMAG